MQIYLSSRKPTEVEWKFTEEGERVRVSIRTGRIIPKPVVERRDGIVPQQWKGMGVSVLDEALFSSVPKVYAVCSWQSAHKSFFYKNSFFSHPV